MSTDVGWYCPTCDTVHGGDCPAWKPKRPLRRYAVRHPKPTPWLVRIGRLVRGPR